MGVLNLTPDSFSGDGLSLDTDAALAQARSFTAQGADIIDIGGESTRPDGQAVSADEEIKRVIPVIERLAGELSVPISIDTYKASVARRAVAAGARMINDVWGLRQDAGLARVAAEAGLPLVLTSNQRDRPAADIMSEVFSDLERAIRQATSAGVPRENIIVDPGIGFGKSLKQNLEIMRRLAELKQLERPILLGTSRKSMIGLVLDLPVEKRLLGTAATVAIGITNGADIVRVHDVKQMREVSQMSDAIIRGLE
jgi:dihydropteroate synthase